MSSRDLCMIEQTGSSRAWWHGHESWQGKPRLQMHRQFADTPSALGQAFERFPIDSRQASARLLRFFFRCQRTLSLNSGRDRLKGIKTLPVISSRGTEHKRISSSVWTGGNRTVEDTGRVGICHSEFARALLFESNDEERTNEDRRSLGELISSRHRLRLR